MAKTVTLESVVAKVRELAKLQEVAKEHANTANRAGTAAKKAITDYLKENKLDLDTRIVVDGQTVSYTVAEGSEKIQADKWLQMYLDDEISKETFLECINVKKAEAELRAGADVIENITVRTPGTKRSVKIVDGVPETKVKPVAKYYLVDAPKTKVPAARATVGTTARRVIRLPPSLHTSAKPAIKLPPKLTLGVKS